MSKLKNDIKPFNYDGPVLVSVANFRAYKQAHYETLNDLFNDWTNPRVPDDIRFLCLRDLLRQIAEASQRSCHHITIPQDGICYRTLYALLHTNFHIGFNNCDLPQDSSLMRELISELLYDLENNIIPQSCQAAIDCLIYHIIVFAAPADCSRLWSYHTLSKYTVPIVKTIAQRIIFVSGISSFPLLLPDNFRHTIWEQCKLDMNAILRSSEKPIIMDKTRNAFGQHAIAQFVKTLIDFDSLNGQEVYHPWRKQMIDESLQIPGIAEPLRQAMDAYPKALKEALGRL